MELTAKELSPYLPYGIEFNDDELDPESGTNGAMIMLSSNSVWIKHDIDVEHLKLPIDKDSIGKPILRPLSQLTEEIEHDGERFCVEEKMRESPEFAHFTPVSEDGTMWDVAEWVKEELIENENCGDLPYDIVQYLISLHFDVFNLISVGLAIEKDQG